MTLVLSLDYSGYAVDIAPDEGFWVYDLVGLAPPSAPPPLTASDPVGTPTRPVAGKRFKTSTTVSRADTGEAVTAGAVTCVARVGNARVAAIGRFRGGRAECVMMVPGKARGKTLRGSIGVRAAGGSIRTPFSFRIS